MSFDHYQQPSSLHEPTLRLWRLLRDEFQRPGGPARAAQAIEEGADLGARNRFGVTLLSMALAFDGPSLPRSRLLILAGAPVGSAAKKQLRKRGGADAILAHRELCELQDCLSAALPPTPSRAARL